MYNTVGKLLTIYAISDIYNLESFARVKQYVENKDNYIITLSGDFVNPTPYSAIDHGKTSIDAVKLAEIDYVSFGNHEFDDDLNELNKFISTDKSTTYISTNIAGIQNTVKSVIYETNGLKLGIIGVCDTSFYTKQDIEFLHFSDIYNEIQKLKENNVNMIIAMTHMSIEDDIRFAEKFTDVDLILAGHVHGYSYINVTNTPIIRTGENAETIAEINIYENEISIDFVDISNVQLHSSFIPFIKKSNKMMNSLDNSIVYYLKTDYSTLTHRKEQNSLMHKLCNMIKLYFGSDIGILNAGFFRLKKVFSKVFTYSDFTLAFPFNDPITTVTMKGEDILDGISFSNDRYYNDGGYLHFFGKEIEIDNYYKVSLSTLILDGVDPNPYFKKYMIPNKYDGIPVRNILLKYLQTEI